MTPELAAWVSIVGMLFTVVGIVAWLRTKLKELAQIPGAVASLDKKIQKHEIWCKILFEEAGKTPPEG